MANEKWLIDAENLMNLARNHIDGTVDCNDIARVQKIDAVEVVRCEKCRHWDSHGNGYGQCRHLRFHIENEIDPTTTRYSFCDKGERREGK